MTATEPLIIDGDSHVLEPPDLWDEYLEAEFRPRAIRITRSIPGRDGETHGIRPLMVRSGAQAASESLAELPEMALELKARMAADEHLIIDRQIVMSGGLSGLGGAETNRADLPYMTYLESAPLASFDTEERIKMYDEKGLAGGVVFPTIGILWDSDDPKLADAYCTRLQPLVQRLRRRVPAAHLSNGAHRPARPGTGAWQSCGVASKLGFKGMFLPPEPVLGRSPADPVFDPLWHEMEDAGIPLCLHVIVRFNRILENPTRFSSLLIEPSRTYGFGMGATFQVIPAMASLIMTGFFDRFPRLKLLCVEAGAGWAPYIAHRLDEKFEMFGYAEKTKLEPSEYMKRNVWYVVEPREKGIDSMMDIIGESQFLWGSDYPHVDSSADSLDQIKASTASLSEHRRKLVLGENAKALYGLQT